MTRREYQKEYYRTHKEQCKAYYRKNAEKYKKYGKKYYRENKWRWQDFHNIRQIIREAKDE